MKLARRSTGRAAGFTLMEILVASGVILVVLLASFGLMEHDTRLTQSTLGISVAEMKAQQMLYGLERELADARGANPKASLTAVFRANTTSAMHVDSTLGFPPSGMLLIDRGTSHIERVAYAHMGANLLSFTSLARSQQCTHAVIHPPNTELLWAALAEPIELQSNPPADLWDGRALEARGAVFFRGDGTGFSYRVPTDPSGGTDYLDGDDLRWGAIVEGQPISTGWAALIFVPKFTFSESLSGQDIDKDGDETDVFDVGQIQRHTWDTANPSAESELGLGPTSVLQERCNWGGDLDHDGFDDPVFLWNEETRELHVRLFVLGRSVSNIPIVRKVESTIFLRNEAGS